MKRIIQTHKSEEIHREHRQGWQDQNPEWEYLFFDDAAMRDLVKRYRPELVIDVYDRLPLIVQKSDLFRYIAVHALGGLYTDTDTVCYAPLDSYLDAASTLPYVSPTHISETTGRPTSVTQWTFWAPSDSFHLERVIQFVARMVRSMTDAQLLEKSSTTSGTLVLTGPGPMDQAFTRREDVNYLPKSAWGYCPGDLVDYSQVKALHLFDGSWVPKRR